MIKLNEKQKKCLGAVAWLFNPVQHRQEGRSTLMAYAFIQHALMYRGIRIDVRDHSFMRQGCYHLMSIIKEMVSNDVELSKRIIIQSDWIRGIPEDQVLKNRLIKME